MRKKKMLEQQIEEQRKTSENILEILKILAEGGYISVHFYKNREPSYFVTPKDSSKSNLELCTKKIFEGLYSRGLLVATHENVHDTFAVQCYVLRILKEKTDKENSK